MSAPVSGRGVFVLGWVQVVCCFLIGFSLYSVYLVGLGPSTESVRAEFGWTQAQITGAYSTAMLITALGAPFAGAIQDRFGPRLCFIVGGLIYALGGLLIALSDSSGLLWYLGWITLIVIPFNFLGHANNVKLLNYWHRRRRGLAVGLVTLSASPAYAMGVAHVLLIDRVGWRADWIIMAGVAGAVAVLLSILVLRNRPEDWGWAQDGDRRLTPEERAAWAARQATRAATTARPAAAPSAEYEFGLGQALRHWVLWLLAIIVFVPTAALQIQTTQQLVYLVDRGMNRVVAAAVLGAMGTIGAGGRFGGGLLVDVVGRGGTRWLYGLALLLQAVGMVILTMAAEEWMVWLFALVFGIGQGMGVTVQMLLIANYYGPAVFATVRGVVTAGGRLGAVVGPMFAAVLYDTTKSYTVAFYTVAVLLFIAAAACALLTPPKVPVGATPATSS